MKVDTVGKTDIKNWLKLAGEVEKLFGPMREEADFLVALEVAIGEERAFCIRDGEAGLIAAIALSYEKNEIEWLAVASSRQKSGLEATASMRYRSLTQPEISPCRRLPIRQ